MLLLVVVSVCEWLRWPFLVKPVERMLNDTLQRQVVLQEDGAADRAGVRFVGGLRMWVPVLQIGAPAWSKQPYFLRAESAFLGLHYSDLWHARKGGVLDIERLSAERLVVHAERQKDGQASWTFGDPNQPPKTEEGAFEMPNVRHLAVRSGDLTYRDAIVKADIKGHLALTDTAPRAAAGTRSAGVATGPGGASGAASPAADSSQAAAQAGLLATAEGTYLNAPLSARFSSASAMPLLATGKSAPAVPVTLSVKSGATSVSFDGSVQDAMNFNGLRGTVKASGPSLAIAGEPFGITLPSTGAFTVNGLVVKQGLLWRFVTERTKVGDSELKAALTYDTRGAKPSLAGRVASPRFQLADLLPTVAGQKAADEAPPVTAQGKAAPRQSKVIPDKELDLPSLRAMDANVLFAFDRADLGSAFAMPLEPLEAHLILDDGKLAINDIDARTAQGRVAGNVALDGTGDVALWRTDLRWSGVRLEEWLKQERGGDTPPYISGQLAGRAQLHGKGKSTAQILGSLDGTVFTSLRNGRLSHLVVEGAGLDIAQALGVLVKGDEALKLQCGVVDMQAENGVLRPRAAILDTPDSTVWVDGTVSLVSEALDLRAIVAPKDFSPLSLRTPVKVQGSFGSPDISLQKDKLVQKLGASALLALINPLAAIIPLVDLGEGKGDDADSCAQVLERARRAAGVAPTEGAVAAAPAGKR